MSKNNEAGVRTIDTTPVVSDFANAVGSPLVWDKVGKALYALDSTESVIPIGGSSFLPSLANGKIWVGNGGGVATAVTPTGDVTITNAGVTAIGSDKVTTVKILDANVTYGKIQNVTDARLLGRSAGSAGAPMEITVGTGLSLAAGSLTATGSATDSFKTIAVSGQSDVVADSPTDTLTLVAGPGIDITTNAGTDTITFANSGALVTFKTIAVSGQSDIVADSATDTLTIVAGTNITLTTNAGTDTLTIAAAASGVPSGTSNPGSPATGDQFFRTDLGLYIYYDGTRWLTTQQYSIVLQSYNVNALATLVTVTTALVLTSGINLSPTYDFWMETFCFASFVSTTNDATKYWKIDLIKNDAAGAATSIVTPQTDADTAGAWVNRNVTIGALLGTSHKVLSVSLLKVSTPGGASLFSSTVIGRLVVT